MEKLQKAATLFLFLISLICFLANLSTAAAATSPVVFIFGDSSVDVGNNNFLPRAPKANFPPYGVDYPGRIPTGRFGNGFLGVDFVAMAAGLLGSPPPYRALSSAVQGRQGVNFASAGSGVLDTTGTNVVTMTQQIKDFSTFAGNLTAANGAGSAAALFTKPVLFYISVGNNDLFTLSAVLIPGNSTQKDEIVAAVLPQFADQLRSLYQLGARKFAVVGTALFGCLPTVRRSVPGGACNQELNDLSLRYKTATRALLEQLAMELEGFEYSFSDVFEITIQILSDPQKYGFTELEAACCGSGRLNAEGPCTPSSTYCGDRNQYLFWDGIHATQAVWRLRSRLSFYGPRPFAYPVNIHSLLES